MLLKRCCFGAIDMMFGKSFRHFTGVESRFDGAGRVEALCGILKSSYMDDELDGYFDRISGRRC